MSYKIVVYFEDLSYGGAEEGGWWYRYGYPVPLSEVEIKPQQFRTRTRDLAHARNLRQKMQKYIDRVVNKERPSISSVSSIGKYYTRIVEGAARPFPEETPHYE